MARDRTAWMDGKQLVGWLEANKVCPARQGWPLVEVLRWHSARKLVLETGHPLPPPSGTVRPANSVQRPVTRYTINTRTNEYRRVLFRVTIRVLEEGAR